MRRPAPVRLADIRHPGPVAQDRSPFVPCRADPVSIEIEAGVPFLEALGTFADKSGYCSGVLDLSGLTLAPFDYVMPDRAVDDRHAAWYSDTQTSRGAVLETAVAILGWRDGAWFAHIHAYWFEDSAWRLGHLLPQTLTTSLAGMVSGFGLKGAMFEAALDPETEFTLFRVKPDPETATEPQTNALITTLAPFADLHHSVAALAGNLGAGTFEVMGLGSLAGAQFLEGPPMTGLISEILLQPGIRGSSGKDLSLPIRAIDLQGRLFSGTLSPGGAPTLITCELLLREPDRG
ncbi:hypothetical protein [Roseibium sp. M-1]